MKKMDDKRELTKEGTGIFLFFLSLFLLLSFLSFDPQDPGLFTSSSNQVKNILGPVGSWTADLFFGLFGLPAYLLIALLLIASYRLFVVREGRLFPWDRVAGTLLLLLSAGTILHLLSPTLPFRTKELLSGGQVGQFLSITGERLFKPLGVSLVSLTVLCLALILSFHFSFRRTLARLIALFRFLKQRSEIQRERKRRATADEAKERAPSKRTKSPPQPEVSLSPVAGLPLEADLPLPVDSRILEKPSASGLQEEKLSPLPMTGNPLPWEEEKGNGGTSFSLDGHEESLNLPPPAQTPKKILLTPRPQDLRKPTEKGKKGYELPPLSLLDLPSEKGPVVDSQELNVKKTIIEEKLREFNIEGKVVEYHPGPVISTFEYLPEKGVKIAQIISLAEDLSMALKAENVRISRIKGKATLGIEIPNYKRQLINLREILENPVFRDSESLLTFSLGKNVRGTPVVTALDSMPHLLIAGATGMGKSVAIHSIILSILYRATPEEVKFILVDPKRLEFSLYEQLPHLLTKIVLDPKEASQALKWGIYEMEKRLKILASFQTRNIKMYNRKVKDLKEGRGDARRDHRGGSRPDALHHHHHRRVGRPDDGGLQGCGELYRPSRPDGQGRGDTPDPRHPEAIGGRDHRHDQEQPPFPDRPDRSLPARLRHDHRQPRCGEAPRERGHALHAPGLSGFDQGPRLLCLRGRDRPVRQVRAFPEQTEVRFPDNSRSSGE